MAEFSRRNLLALFGSAAAALVVAKTLPLEQQLAIEGILRDVEAPPGVSYQWNVPEMINAESQWVPVPRERHADLLGVGGGIIVSGGLTLCERSANVTATDLERSKAAASKQVDDWWDNAAKLFGDRQRGFVAAVRTGYGPQDAAVGMEFTKSIEAKNDRP